MHIIYSCSFDDICFFLIVFYVVFVAFSAGMMGENNLSFSKPNVLTVEPLKQCKTDRACRQI